MLVRCQFHSPASSPKRYIVTAGAWPEAKAECGPVRCPLTVYVAPSLKQGTAEPLLSVTWKATGTLVTSIASACAAPAGPARTKARAIMARSEGRRSVAVRVISAVLPFGGLACREAAPDREALETV